MAVSPPVVLLHAFPLDGTMWAPQLAGIERLGPALAPDLPGFGGQPPGAPDLAAYADAVVAGMDAAGFERAVVVGLSMGGYVALRLLDRHRARVAGLVLADTRAEADDDAGRARRTGQAARARAEGVAWLPDALVPALLGETTRHQRPEVVAEVRARVARADPEGVARALEAMRDRPDSTPLLATIDVPTLVIVGAEDALTPPATARGLAAAIPGARLEIVPEAGHLANLERPLAFDEVLFDFLGGLEGR
jgi:3-oxoadipate enol-lactonase